MSFLVTWKPKQVQKESLKEEILLGRPMILSVKQGEALGFLQLSLTSTELWQDLSPAGCQASVGDHYPEHFCKSALQPKTSQHWWGMCVPLLWCGRDSLQGDRNTKTGPGSAEPSLMGKKDKPLCSGEVLIPPWHSCPQWLQVIKVWEYGDADPHLSLAFLWHKLHFVKKERGSQENNMAVRRFLCFERQVILKYFLMDG